MAKFSLILFSLCIFISVMEIASQLPWCPDLIFQNGKVSITSNRGVSEIQCTDDGIEADGGPLMCLKHRGNTPVPSCIRHGCPSLTPPRHGVLYYNYNDREVKVICDGGFTLTKRYDTIACDSGVWNATLPTCKVFCPDLFLENGQLSIKFEGRVRKIECIEGWIGYGAVWSLLCVKQRRNIPVPSCIKRGCPSLIPPRHGTLANFMAREVEVICDPGYTLTKSYDTIACDSGVWNATLPACKASYTSPDMACTFERDTCGWTNSPDNHFFWELKSAALLHLFDQNNSPVTDHTLGTATGQFMIASTVPDLEGRRATLYSPVFKAARGGVACFNFFYHIYGGRDTGELRVYFKPQDTSIEFLAPDFQTSSRSHASWVRKKLVFTNVTQPFQIVIQAEGGIVLLDDVMVNYGVLCVIHTCTP